MSRHPKTEPLYKRIAELDFEQGDVFCFKSGGDGDNGEMLMDLLDQYFHETEPCTSQRTTPDE